MDINPTITIVDADEEDHFGAEVEGMEQTETTLNKEMPRVLVL